MMKKLLMYISKNKPEELHLYLVFFVAARAGVTRAPRPHAAASNRRTFLSHCFAVQSARTNENLV